KAAQRELEMKAADERRAFEQQLEKQKADYDTLVRESARIGLKERMPATHATDNPQSLLKTEPKLGFGDVGKSDSKYRDERPTRSRNRRTTAAARAPSPDLFRRATGYSDDEEDEGEPSDGGDDATDAKRRLGESKDEKRRLSSAADRIAAPVAPINVKENAAPRNRAVINDSAVAPKAFTGITGVAAEIWLQYFFRYKDYKGLSRDEAVQLFRLLQREDSALWLQTLSPAELEDFDSLVEAFKSSFFPSPELVWLYEEEVWT